MAEINALDYRYVKRAVYDRRVDRLTSEIAQMKKAIRDIQENVMHWEKVWTDE